MASNARVVFADLRDWTPKILVRALASRVLVVATTRVEGTWKAYCDAVPGECHDTEWQAILDRGDCLPEEIAAAIFPEFAEIPYAR